MNLQQMVEAFAEKWGPFEPPRYQRFVRDLRALMEAYGKAALAHQSLPDTEHQHGEPV